ncbi:MAG: hypothetical protein HZA34_00395 [Candidatus Pacebacteria bacterium]|nr:hypothetical protein [Candidatus Paceibacterota bacterium]
MKLLVTHRAPDIDAIASVWILKRFDPEHYADAKIAFVDAGGTLSQEEMAKHSFPPDEITYTDTGFGQFDHHQPDKALQRMSAASLVFDHVCVVNPENKKDWALQQIVEYCLVDDHFEDYFFEDADSVRHLFALRGILHGSELAGLHDDDAQIVFGFRCLDAIYSSLKERHKAMQELKKGIEFESRWGKSVGLETSNQAAVRYGQLKGYMLVVQKDPRRGGVNIKAAPRKELDLTPLYEKIVARDKKGSWFFHNGRHMIINNSSHANQTPTPLSLQEVMEIVRAC